MLRYNGLNSQKVCEIVSTNAKMDTMQAAVLLQRLKSVNTLIDKRRKIADMYAASLSKILKTPYEDSDRKNVYFTYTIVTSKRDELFEYLTKNGIEVKIYHTNLMDEIAYRQHRGECENARELSQKKLALPCHEKMTESQVEYIIEKIKEFFED